MDRRFETIVKRFAESHNLDYEIGDDRVKLNGDIFSSEAALYYMFGFIDGEAYEAKKLTDTIKKSKDNSLKRKEKENE